MISELDIQLASQRLTKVTRKHVQRVLRYISDDDLDDLRVIRVIEECRGDDEAKRNFPILQDTSLTDTSLASGSLSCGTKHALPCLAKSLSFTPSFSSG